MRARQMIGSILITAATLMSWTTTAPAAPPAQITDSNGIPGGIHYDLNIAGEKAGFSCPEQQYDRFGAPVYGNTVYVPEDGKGVQIILQFGTENKAEAQNDLIAADPCSAFDGNAAVVHLPTHEGGYRVFAKAAAMVDQSVVLTPSPVSVQDEYGEDLVYLGLITRAGFAKADGATVTRAKGSSTGVDIARLFQWSGEACSFSPPDESFKPSQLCGFDRDGDGIYDDFEEPATDGAGAAFCTSTEYRLASSYCKSYVDEWIFKVGESAEQPGNSENLSSKLLQVSFYPN